MATPVPYAVIATVATTLNGEPAPAGTVLNLILWDGVTPWPLPAGTELRVNTIAMPLAIGQTTTV
jgi:hypothetical protein